MPTLPAERLAGAYLYYDARADDARLTLTIARTAAARLRCRRRQRLPCHAVAQGRRRTSRVAGATVDDADGNTFDVRATAVVNAAGVWADDVRALDEGSHPNSIRPAKGIHITVPWSKVRNDIAVVMPVPKDKRSVFVVPWADSRASPVHLHRHHRHRLRRPPRRPAVHSRGRRVPARGDQRARSRRQLTADDVLGTWAGLRPLVQDARRPGAPPTCPAGTASLDRPAAWSRSPAASSRPIARWRPTPSTRSRVRRSSVRRATGTPHPPACQLRGRRRLRDASRLECAPAAGNDTLLAPAQPLRRRGARRARA